MKNNSRDSGKKSLLQQFAVKSQKKHVKYNDRTVIYNRCSTEKQDSLEWQEKVCTDFCKQNNLVIIKVFGEKVSAITDDRKEFQEMLKFCQKENICNIVIFSYDRFSRSGNVNLVKELRIKGIKVHAATQSVDDKTPSGRLSQSMYLMFAEMENEQRREKIIEGQKSKLRKGEWVVAPPIGYKKQYITGKKEHDHDKPQCFINDNGKLLRQAFLWKDKENLSHNEIIKRLKTMGMNISPSQLSRIFRNPFYCGYITSCLLEDGELIRGKHEALISEDIFLRVNGLVNNNPHGWKMMKQNDEMPLKTIVECGLCGRPLTAYPQKGKYIYYKCPNKGCCVNISNIRLHKLFADELSKFIIDPKLLPIIKGQMVSTYLMLYNNEAAREKPMKDELTKLRNELEAMEFNFATSKISSDLFQKFSSAHRQKIIDIEAELEIFTRDNSNLEIYINTAIKSANSLLEMWKLLKFDGKVRLQKLIFPSGLKYVKENDELRTNKVNPIFSAITSISTDLKAQINYETCHENLKLQQLYLMFTSSNFFWENLIEIQNQLNEMEHCYPHMWENTTYTGLTEFVEFNYTSNLTELQTSHNKNQNLYLFNSNSSTGTTNHLSSTKGRTS